MIRLPKVILLKELPQWITSSDKGAYHPKENTIYITRLRYLFHELLHWLAFQLQLDWAHRIIDWRKVFYD